MPEQVKYYDDFAHLHEESILACPQPEFWTTDYANKGRIYLEIKDRVEKQQELMLAHFRKDHMILDIGCGFGRQSFCLASKGFRILGTDTSSGFIDVARKLFSKYGLPGVFLHTDLDGEIGPGKFKQVILFDVLEHAPPSKRKNMLKRIAQLMERDGLLIISLPPVRRRLSSWLNNNIRKNFTSQFPYFREKEEHPYPIPGKKQVLAISGSLFSLIEFTHTSLSDFYLFRRN